MKESETTAANPAAPCSSCGGAHAGTSVNVEIVIRKGHVRRASMAADGVCEAAQGAHGIEHGMVLMGAILLVERLAAAYHCDPRSIISKMGRCFDVKDSYLRAPTRCN